MGRKAWLFAGSELAAKRGRRDEPRVQSVKLNDHARHADF